MRVQTCGSHCLCLQLRSFLTKMSTFCLTGRCWGKNLQNNTIPLDFCAILKCSHFAQALLILLDLDDLNVPGSVGDLKEQ